MFHFLRRPMPMLSYLQAYVADWYWCHSTDVVPMIVAAPAEAWPLWTEEMLRDSRLRRHLIRALIHWRAFRRPNNRIVPDPYEAFRHHLPDFISDLQSLPGSTLRLADVEDADIEELATAITRRLLRFGWEVKGVESCVLPSKAAHFLLLGLIPAYDRQIIRDQVLRRLLPASTDMESYLLLCWWILQQFKAENTLQRARDLVAEYMLGQPMEWTRHLPRPARGHWLLHSMDSVVAEYTLIQMARAAEGGHLLRWMNAVV